MNREEEQQNLKNMVAVSGGQMGKTASPSEIFDRVCVGLKTQLGKDVYSSWFGRMKLEEAAKSVVRLSVPTAFLRSWINNHYLDRIVSLWQAEDEDVLRVEIVVRSATRGSGLSKPRLTDNRLPNEAPTPPQARAPRQNGFVARNAERVEETAEIGKQEGLIGSPLDPRYNFETFVNGPSNRVTLAAAQSVAEANSGAMRINPLFVHASVGLGKTHLLQAIAAQTLKNNPQSRVVYLTAEYFMWRFATAIRDNKALSLKEQFRDIDLLLIDDMQFLQGKSIQHEFCHLINMLLDSARQVVVAADRPPEELESLEVRIRSRIKGGVVLKMTGPDYPMRLAILEQRLQAAKTVDPSIEISHDVLVHVAKTVVGSGRDLEGAFNQLVFRNSFDDLSVEQVDEYLGHIYRSGEPKKVKIEDIQRIVARHFNVSRTELLSNRRTRTVVKPRQMAMYLSKTLTPRSLPEIGRHFGGRDHTTVLHAVRKIDQLVQDDSKLAQELELLKRLIHEQT